MFAMGVFTAFSMAGYGMTKRHLKHRGPGWRYKLVINLSAGILSTSVVAIFAIAKFTEGAWLVVVVFPMLVLVLMRLNKQYRAEASVLEMARDQRPDLTAHPRHRVLLFVDSIDPALVEALRYAKGLHADALTAVHLVLDEERAARLQVRWPRFGHDIELQMIDCDDRNVCRAAEQLVAQVKRDYPDATVTALLSRRMYSPLADRLLHDRTADKMAGVISRIPGASAQILAYDVAARVARALRTPADKASGQSPDPSGKEQATSPIH